MAKLKLDDFQLGSVLGVGTVGTIYAGEDRRTGNKVAIKLLHPAVCQDELIRARFRREMSILERLRHPNIIRYYGGGERDGQLFFAMELIDGGSVKDLLEQHGSLPWPEVAAIAAQVCSALQCAHNNGIIHRDIKPANLFLTRNGQVKLGDFGIARDTHTADLTSDRMTVGTHAYMPPEQITGELPLSGKADLYALGCVMFELLTGEKPFQGANFAQLFDQHLRQPPPYAQSLVPDCPKELSDTIAQLLAKSPDDRPFNARRVQADMMRLLERYQLPVSEASLHDRNQRDVGAANAVEIGREVLSRRVAQRFLADAPRELSWTKWVIVALVLTMLVTIAAIFGR
jgi:serine/threonine protein kinase